MPTMRRGVWVDTDVRGALRALRGISREASRELRQASVGIVNRLVPLIRFEASWQGRQSRAAAKSVRPRSDRVPAIALGGRKRVTHTRNGYAGSIAFGADAGSFEHTQFPPARAGGSYWFWDTIGRHAKEIMRMWGRAYDQVIEQWRGADRGD